MVQSILDGRKTQTRRVIKPQPEVSAEGYLMGEWLKKPLAGLLLPKLQDITIHCPFGKIGDRLWVRETFMRIESAYLKYGKIIYKADYISSKTKDGSPVGWKSPIFMSKLLSRITLEITNISVERLQDISDEDAVSEGVDRTNTSISGYASERYKRLWESINGKGSWNDNPYVWRIEFRRV
jgi:hypothetical protein